MRRTQGEKTSLQYSNDQTLFGRGEKFPRRARRRHQVYRILLASCFDSSRQWLMNSCARGLMVRFFKMTIPTGAWPSDCLTARTCNSGRLVERLYAEYGQIEIKRPVANRPILSSAVRRSRSYGDSRVRPREKLPL